MDRLPDEETCTAIADPSREPQPPKEASLVQIYGPELGQRYVLVEPEITVGRGDSNRIVVDDTSVSRVHARIVMHAGTVSLEDLGSTNGSLINNQEIQGRIKLRHGDLVKIGSVVFKFLSGGNPEALYHEEIYRMTITDGLTGVANRRYFLDFLDREVARSTRYRRPLSLAMIDVDHFKQVNDDYGHLAGDYVLRRIALDLQANVRREELLARYGGEEFAVVMPETEIDNALVFAEKMRQIVEETEFEFDRQSIRVTISIGLAKLEGGNPSVRAFVKSADAQLYRAKKEGRNRICLAAG